MRLEYYIKRLPWLFRTFKLREKSLEKALGDFESVGPTLGALETRLEVLEGTVSTLEGTVSTQGETISTLEDTIDTLEADVSTAKSDITGKQDTLEAGDNISIDGVVISATIPAE